MVDCVVFAYAHTHTLCRCQDYRRFAQHACHRRQDSRKLRLPQERGRGEQLQCNCATKSTALQRFFASTKRESVARQCNVARNARKIPSILCTTRLRHRSPPAQVDGSNVRVKPEEHHYAFETDRKVPRTGVMLVGWGGNNGTTGEPTLRLFVAGVIFVNTVRYSDRWNYGEPTWSQVEHQRRRTGCQLLWLVDASHYCSHWIEQGRQGSTCSFQQHRTGKCGCGDRSTDLTTLSLPPYADGFAE